MTFAFQIDTPKQLIAALKNKKVIHRFTQLRLEVLTEIIKSFDNRKMSGYINQSTIAKRLGLKDGNAGQACVSRVVRWAVDMELMQVEQSRFTDASGMKKKGTNIYKVKMKTVIRWLREDGLTACSPFAKGSSATVQKEEVKDDIEPKDSSIRKDNQAIQQAIPTPAREEATGVARMEIPLPSAGRATGALAKAKAELRERRANEFCRNTRSDGRDRKAF